MPQKTTVVIRAFCHSFSSQSQCNAGAKMLNIIISIASAI
jgi:hypothetical protein